MIIGIGNDIIEIDRIKTSIERSGDTFLKRIFTDQEIEYCESKGKSKWESYAARFAAKEATTKAMPAHIDKIISWKDVEVVKDQTNKITLTFSQNAQDLIPKNWNILVTLSHSKSMSMATVLIDEVSK